MKMSKWNYKTKTYDIIEVPKLNYKTYCDTMDEVVNCPHCQKELRYGECYTSMEFHNYFGTGYSVCGECYEKEWNHIKENEVTEK